MNKVVLIGRLTKDPELKFAQGSGKAVTKFTLAVDRNYKKEGQPEADFINCIAFEKRAETIKNYVFKGHKLGVTGNIQTGKYTNKEGQTVFTTEVVVDEFEFLQPKQAGVSNGQNSNNGQASNANESGFTQVEEDEDIPF